MNNKEMKDALKFDNAVGVKQKKYRDDYSNMDNAHSFVGFMNEAAAAYKCKHRFAIVDEKGKIIPPPPPSEAK